MAASEYWKLGTGAGEEEICAGGGEVAMAGAGAASGAGSAATMVVVVSTMSAMSGCRAVARD